MPSLSRHHSRHITKLLLVGDSSSGKTSALASLARAGYKLRILDFDNGTDVLADILKNEPEALANVIYEPLTDKLNASNGETRLANPQKSAFTRGLNLLTQWKVPETKNPDGSTNEAYDLGRPDQWGPDCVVVIDSLTMFSECAKRYTDTMFPSKDGRMAIYNAQQYIEQLLAMLYADTFATNVIFLAHIREITDEEGNVIDSVPNSVGKALPKRIGAYFNNVAKVERVLRGTNEIRTIHTRTQDTLALKCSAPSIVAKSYPHETGLADFFAALRGNSKPTRN